MNALKGFVMFFLCKPLMKICPKLYEILMKMSRKHFSNDKCGINRSKCCHKNEYQQRTLIITQTLQQ